MGVSWLGCSLSYGGKQVQVANAILLDRQYALQVKDLLVLDAEGIVPHRG
jgi:hypothetical protein